ncbi:hypothetical protein BDB01DRAFT_836794 [Pilobolus umbonatus]|nr:hypothetical protein BDB01DRAFT_836794 [Pilobolus umbonatus]
MAFKLDPFPKLTGYALASFFNARIIIFTVVAAKIALDRLYKYASIINPVGLVIDGEATLDIIEYQNPWTADDIFNALNGYGSRGRQAYLTYLYYDVIFVVARTVPICLICSWAFQKVPEKYRPGVWIPVLNMLVDIVESLFLTVDIKLFPQRVELVELMTAYIIQLKWVTFQLTLAIIAVSFFTGIYFSFHSLLADSVLLEKDRLKKVADREKVKDVLDRAAARRAAAAQAQTKKSTDKKSN